MLLGLVHLRGYVYIPLANSWIVIRGWKNFKYQRRNRVEVEMVK